MPNLPISQLTNLTAATNSSLIAIVASGVTYNMNIEDLWKSQPFGTMYQDWIPDAASAHTIGSIAYPLKSIYVSTGSVFIGPNNSLAIDDNGVLYSTNVFAAPTFQVGNVTSSGQVVTTSGVTFSVVNNEMLMISNSGGTVTNLTRQPVPTGGTINQVLTQTGNTNYAWGWVDFTGGTSGTNGSSGTSGTSGTNGSSGTSGTSGTNGSSGTSGTSGTNGSSGTSGTSGSSGTSSTGTTRYYGAFYDGGTQPLLAVDTPQVMSANTTTHSSGVVLSASTRFVVLNTGTYNFQFSAQLNKTSSNTDEVAIWFRKNGVDIPYSNTEMQVAKQGSTGKLVASWNYVDVLNANEYLEIVWASADITYELLYEPVQTVPYAKPATPSIIVTLTQV